MSNNLFNNLQQNMFQTTNPITNQTTNYSMPLGSSSSNIVQPSNPPNIPIIGNLLYQSSLNHYTVVPFRLGRHSSTKNQKTWDIVSKALSNANQNSSI